MHLLPLNRVRSLRVGLRVGHEAITDTQLRDVLLALHPGGGRPRGDDWDRCRTPADAIRGWLKDGLRLTKIRKLLARQGVDLPYPALYRFHSSACGKTSTTRMYGCVWVASLCLCTQPSAT